MNREDKHNWTYALRSGEYEQGDSRLRTLDNKFCCLGVYAHLHNAEWEHPPNMGCYTLNSDPGYLSGDLSKNIGSSRGALEYPVVYDGVDHWSVSALNDAGMPFNKIADVIDQQF